jgi:hypothetical protein
MAAIVTNQTLGSTVPTATPTFYRKDDTVSYAYGVIAMLALV